VVRRAVETALAADLEPVLVVTGHERERVEAELRELPCRPVFNPDFAGGLHTSLRTGIAAVPEDAAGALVCLADMPLVEVPMLDRLIDAFRRDRPPLVISTYEGVLAPPMLYGRGLFPELRALEGEGCGKRVVKQHRAEAVELAWPAAALSDLDVPDDLERVRAFLRAG
jgi:molybdenum cofactor cytidylyltransferase